MCEQMIKRRRRKNKQPKSRPLISSLLPERLWVYLNTPTHGYCTRIFLFIKCKISYSFHVVPLLYIAVTFTTKRKCRICTEKHPGAYTHADDFPIKVYPEVFSESSRYHVTLETPSKKNPKQTKKTLNRHLTENFTP